MPFTITPTPPFSWSHSRDRTLSECARRYYWATYGSWLGWMDDAEEAVRVAYRLKQLSTLSGTLGQEVHERAREIATAIRDGKDRPPLDDCMDRTRAALNRVWRGSRDMDGFLRAPKRSPMLLESYYRLPITNDRLAALRAKLQRCLTHLYTWPGWGALEDLGPDRILLYEPTDPAEIGGVQVYAAPDLVICGDRVRIVDWKTGNTEGAMQQLACYALYLRERGSIEGFDGVAQGHVVSLDTGEEDVIEITPAHLARAEQRIRDSVWKMRGYIVGMDPERNEPVGRDRFALPVATDRCQWCPYYELCEQELSAPQQHFGPF